MTAMEKKLELAKDRLAFLVEQTQFSPADMSLNTQTFTWHGRMDDIFEEHKVIAQEKKAQYEEALKVWWFLSIVSGSCLSKHLL